MADSAELTQTQLAVIIAETQAAVMALPDDTTPEAFADQLPAIIDAAAAKAGVTLTDEDRDQLTAAIREQARMMLSAGQGGPL